jgi:glutamine amidotransferase
MIAIIDYGMGNLRSVQKAIERVGGDAQIVHAPKELARADKIVLPGVGAFQDAIDRIRSQKLDEAILSACRSDMPFLGICLGLQMLFETAYENGMHKGLGIFGGEVRRFDFPQTQERPLPVPQMGWNQIRFQRPCPIYDGLRDGEYVYFCHSYYVAPTDENLVATRTDYGIDFVSSIRRGNLFATQFHPEKSQSVGLKILENFVRL